MKCWCGNSELVEFGEGYRLCRSCETLVSARGSAAFNPRVSDENKDLYGEAYWFGHQTGDLGCPDIVSRSRSDLSERCVHWMRSVLEFKLPPARVLEIGCAHGGFVAMLRQAGFEAMGLELSPAIVRLATDTFRVPVLTGPIEDQSIPAGSLDGIVMMDVLEHLADPMATVRKCVELLKPDGVLLMQTPAYPEGTTLGQLRAGGHKFPQMLDANEHLFLFSQRGVRELFHRVGAANMEFIPAVFGFYDMSFVISPSRLVHQDAERQAAALCRTVGGRFVQAMLDLDQRRLELLAKYRALRDQGPIISRVSA